MIAKLHPYSKYKDSGVEWIGKVPNEWEVFPLQRLLVERKEMNKPIKTTNLLSLSLRTGVIPYANKDSGGNKAKEDLSAYKLAYPGDIVVNSMNVIVGSVGLSKYFGAVSPVYYMLYPRNSDVLIEFFDVIFQNKTFQKSLFGLGNGIMIIESKTSGNFNTIRMRIPMSKLKRVILPYPNIEEQAAIVKYLKHTTNKIQKFINSKQKLIKLLEEQKQSIIHQAVTGAINVQTGKPYQKYKDSGVEWLGKVPEGWEVRKLKNCTTEKLKYGANESGEEQRPNWPRYIRITDFGNDGKLTNNNFLCLNPLKGDKYLLNDGDVLFARSGATVGKTYQFKTKSDDKQKYCFAGYLIKAVPNPKIVLSDYLYAFTISKSFDNWKSSIFNKATIENIGADKYALLNLLLPPIDNQKTILIFINKECNLIDKTISHTKQEIELLREYKTRLISDVVTGKVDVREIAKTLPDDLAIEKVLDESDELKEEIIDDANELEPNSDL